LRALGLALAVVLLAPSAAFGKTTPDKNFSGSAAGPMTGQADIPVTIASDDADGHMSVEVHWTNPFDDFDLYVYKKNSTGGLDQVGSSAGGPPSTSEQTTIDAQGTSPIPPGDYIVRVENYAATSPDFSGTVKFGPLVLPNNKPTARLKAVQTVKKGKRSVLDASGSSDSDGSIVNYSWDLNGDGSMETDGGTSPVMRHKFSVGTHHVTVRVTDNGGKRAYATRTVKVTRQ
jgi:PKD domain